MAEDKLDEDFLFYLSFTSTFFGCLIEKQDIKLCQVWLQKLCGEQMMGVDAKRKRNIYLSHLVLAMQDGQMKGPFLEPPPDGELIPACSAFGPVQPEIQEPTWLEDVVEGSGGDFSHTSRDGRTYLATRSLAEGRGAFGYLAVTVADGEPLWFNAGAGEGAVAMTCTPSDVVSVCAPCLKSSPVPENVAELLLTRPSPEEVSLLFKTYQSLLNNIDDVLAGKDKANKSVIKLMKKQEINMVKNPEDKKFLNNLSEKERDFEILRLLRTNIKKRILDVEQRALMLDNAAQRLFKYPPDKTVEVNNVEVEDDNDGDEEGEEMVDEDEEEENELEQSEAMPQESISITLWKEAVKPESRNLKKLQTQYSSDLVDRFVQLLTDEKRKVVDKFNNHHSKIVEEIRKDMYIEVKELLDKYMKARNEWNKLSQAVEDVQQAQKEVLEFVSCEMDDDDDEDTRIWDEKILNEMREQLKKSQKRYEDESQQVEELSSQIQSECERSKVSNTVNDKAIQQMQASNNKLEAHIAKYEAEIYSLSEHINNIMYRRPPNKDRLA